MLLAKKQVEVLNDFMLDDSMVELEQSMCEQAYVEATINRYTTYESKYRIMVTGFHKRLESED